jgi:Transport and Golgi organisation 2
MCTVTYLPITTKEFILTSNRDEDVKRPTALPVQEYAIANKTIYFPKDQKANGTWIAYDTNGYTLCLLNGAFKKHTSKGNYKKSRGLMLLDFYDYNDPKKFADEYNFEGIEPFTMIMVYCCAETKQIILFELKWDEAKPYLIQHDSSLPQIWSSVTLYSQEVIEQRNGWFNNWLSSNTNYTNDEILFFHHFGGVGKTDNDLIINRGDKKTVSISCIHKSTAHTEIIYEDIVNKKLYKNKVINC